MRFLFILTGGTIGSTLQNGCLGVQAPAFALPELYCSRYHTTLDYDVIAPYTMLSENSTGETLKALVRTVQEQLAAGYTGIFVTHGTDTLAYSAAALGYTLGAACPPVCLISANYPPQDVRSNALANLHGAVRFFSENPRGGVWVSYQNPGEELRIHRATRLLESAAFSDRVDSAANLFFGAYAADGTFHPNPYYSELPDEIPPLSAENLSRECTQIARILPYVGMEYTALSPKIRAVLHGTYHSGTLNTASPNTQEFFRQARQQGIPVFLTGVSPAQIPYESTRAYESLHATVLPPTAPAAMVLKLWLALSAGQNLQEILHKSLCGDILP